MERTFDEQRRRRMVIGLVVVLVLAGLVSRALFSFRGGRLSIIPFCAYFGIAAGQVMLLGIWCALGRGIFGWRAAISVIGLTLVWCVSFYDAIPRWLNRHTWAIPVTYFGFMFPLVTTALLLGLIRAFHSAM